MLERRESQHLVFQKRRRKADWARPVIFGLFLTGIALVIVSFALREDESEMPAPPERRAITAHASSRPSPQSAEPTAQTDPEAPADESKPAPKAAVAESKPVAESKSAPKASSDCSTRAAAASLAALPIAHGATAPQLGRFRLQQGPVLYDKNTSPEAILAAQATTYIVVAGDILGRIAQKHGCTTAQLQRVNRLRDDQIKIGQKLLIPNCKDGTLPDLPPPDDAQTPPVAQRGRWWKRSPVNTTALPKLMAEENFKPPQKFMAFILELTFDSTRQVVTRERAFDYRGTSSSNSGWNPASAVKIFAAIGALHRIDELGFTSRAKVTFHGKKTYSTTVSALIEAAIIQSDNIAYNRVVQLASFDKLHQEILTSKFGITQTALNRAYQISTWESLGENPSLRIAPAITLQEGKKTHKIPASRSKAHAVCSSSACTSLQDLAESSRRLMLQEQLPASESFDLKPNDLIMLRRAMRSPDRTRGTEIVDRFAAVFKDSRVKFYSKPGFSEDWFTDNVYIFDPRYNQAWIVVMTGYPGRSSLNSAATAIAKIISAGKLRKIP